MKKSLVALATLAATSVFAQQLPSGANPNPAWGNGVLITGGFDLGYGSLTYKGGNKYTGVMHNGTYTSQIDLAGVQDLGGGMKADFWFESDIIPVTQYNTGVATLNNNAALTGTNATGAQAASTWGNGQVKAGLSGSFGYLAMGAVNNAALDFNQMSQPFGTAYGSGYGITVATVGNGYGAAAKVRYDNSTRYLTPQLMPGLIGSAVFRGKNTNAANSLFSSTNGLQAQSGITELALIYRNGPATAIYVNQKDDGNGIRGATGAVATSGANFTTTSVGGNYVVGATTLYAGYQIQKNELSSGTTGAVNNKASRLGIRYQLTPDMTVSATMNSLTDINSKKTTANAVGADYFLSKTTAIYGRYEAVNDAAGKLASTDVGATGAGFVGTAGDNNRKRIAAGLRVTF